MNYKNKRFGARVSEAHYNKLIDLCNKHKLNISEMIGLLIEKARLKK